MVCTFSPITEIFYVRNSLNIAVAGVPLHLFFPIYSVKKRKSTNQYSSICYEDVLLYPHRPKAVFSLTIKLDVRTCKTPLNFLLFMLLFSQDAEKYSFSAGVLYSPLSSFYQVDGSLNNLFRFQFLCISLCGIFHRNYSSHV